MYFNHYDPNVIQQNLTPTTTTMVMSHCCKPDQTVLAWGTYTESDNPPT